MAYGTPRSLEDVGAYYTDIRRGRPPPPDLLEELTHRYRAIGGSPLLEITEAQALGISRRLGVKSYLGQKHAAPFIRDAVADMAADRVERAVGLVLAPHFSQMSIGDYEARARSAAEDAGWTGDLEIVPSWHLEPGYIRFLASEVKSALNKLSTGARTGAEVIFSAHSLPDRILRMEDPYPRQLQETAEAVATEAGLSRWTTGWQSAGRTKEPWLGPDVVDLIADLASTGVPGVIVCPCGFVADHLEVLYDVDIEARRAAETVGIEFARTAMPNDNPSFLDVVAGVIERAFHNP